MCRAGGSIRRGGPGSSDSLCFFLKWKFLLLLLGRQSFWRAVEVYLIGRLRFQAGVWSGRVVEVDVAVERGPCFADGYVGVQVDLFVLDRSPYPLDEDIVAPAALAVHADADPVFL